MNETAMWEQVKHTQSGLHMNASVDEIVARARARRHRMSGLAVAVIAIGVTVTGGLLYADRSPVSSSGVNSSASAAASVKAIHVRLAGFWLDSEPGHGGTLTLIKGGPIDPNVLRQKLAQAGMPAIVNVGRSCHNATDDVGEALDRVIATRRLADGTVTTTFTSSAMPDGLELSIGMFPQGQTFALVTADAPFTCDSVTPSFR